MDAAADHRSARLRLPRINGATRKLPTNCPHCGCKKVVRKGTRRKKLEIVQLWLCTYCRRVFTPLPPAARHTTYPPRVIIDALTTYNLGYPLAETARRLRGRGYSVSGSSLSRWLATYRSLATYERLRSRGLRSSRRTERSAPLSSIIARYNVILQALPLPSGDGTCKIVLRPPKDEKGEKGEQPPPERTNRNDKSRSRRG